MQMSADIDPTAWLISNSMDPPHDTFSKVKDNTSISMHLTPTDTKQEIHLEMFYL